MGLRTKLIQDWFIGEKWTDFITFLHVRESFHKKMKTGRSDQNRKLFHLLDKDTINMRRNDTTKGFSEGQ